MKMGCFKVPFRVSRVGEAEPILEIVGIVDTGAAFPVIPEDLLERLGIEPTGEEDFVLADGSRIMLPIGEARLHYGGRSAPCLVVFGLPGTDPLFGALALESLRLEVDPVNQRLKKAESFLAAAG